MRKLGLGEDVPYGVYRDWKRWCRYPHYFFDDPQAKAIASRFALVKMPMAAATSTDDLWASPQSRDAFFKGYTGAAITSVDFTP